MLPVESWIDTYQQFIFGMLAGAFVGAMTTLLLAPRRKREADE